MNPQRPSAPSHLAIACRAARAFARDQAGVTAIEYALLGSLIAVVAATGIGTLGSHVTALWTMVANAVSAAL